MRAAALLLCLCTTAAAQISVPAVTPAGRLVRASYTPQAGDDKQTSILWIPPTGIDHEPLGDRVVMSGLPGVYEIQAIITVADWDARTLDQRFARATFAIGDAPPTPPNPDPPGPSPPPEPEPDPEPTPQEGPRTVMLLYESEDSSPQLAALMVGLRNGTPAKYLADKKHRLLILDDDATDQLGRPIALVEKLLARGIELPALFICDSATGKCLKEMHIESGTTADNIVERVREAGG